ncbi:MAG: zinc ABC transporter substrate-binding protein [Cyanobacteria bacterium P01_F01_bin.150]
MTKKSAASLGQHNLLKKRLQPLSAALVASLLLGSVSCSSETTSSNNSTTAESSGALAEVADSEELKVVTTFLPITQFTKAVVGDRAEVTQLIPLGTGPHDYQAKPSEVQLLSQADVLVQNGLEMEAFLEDMIDNAENSELAVIDSSEGVATISIEEVEAHQKTLSGHGDEHHGHEHHGHEHHADEAHGDEEVTAAEVDSEYAGEHDEHEGDGTKGGHHHAHGEFDPHIWLDPKRAIQQVENIRDGLIAADPEGTDEYTTNAAAYIAELESLDAGITADLAPYAGQTFVSNHDFAAYFADSYGLEAEFLVGVPEENPSPEDVKNVVDIVTDSNLKTLLTEPQAGQALEALAADLNVQVSTFDPLETGGEDALEPDYYLLIMRQNAENLTSAFTDSPQSFLPHWYPNWHPAISNLWRTRNFGTIAS